MIKSSKRGYLQLIDMELILEKARDQDLFIEVQPMVGTFVTEESIIYKVWGSDNSEIEQLQTYMTIGEERSTIQDLSYGMEKMADIVLRAISLPSTTLTQLAPVYWRWDTR
jgi:uncharacterized membrane protein